LIRLDLFVVAQLAAPALPRAPPSFFATVFATVLGSLRYIAKHSQIPGHHELLDRSNCAAKHLPPNSIPTGPASWPPPWTTEQSSKVNQAANNPAAQAAPLVVAQHAVPVFPPLSFLSPAVPVRQPQSQRSRASDWA